MWGIWDCRMDYMGDDKDHRPGGAWWHNEGELVDADVRY